MHLELLALSSLIEDTSSKGENSTFWSTVAFRIRSTLLRQQRTGNSGGGLFRRLVSPARDLLADRYTLDEGVSAFLATLIKSYIASGGGDTEALTAYLQAVNSGVKNGLIRLVETTTSSGNSSSTNSFAYSVQKRVVGLGSRTSPSSSSFEGNDQDDDDVQVMKFAGCHLGAVLGLSGLQAVKRATIALSSSSSANSSSSVNSIRNRQNAHRLKGNLLLAERLLETCTAAGRMTPSGLTPARMEFISSSSSSLSTGGAGEELIVQERFKEAIPLT